MIAEGCVEGCHMRVSSARCLLCVLSVLPPLFWWGVGAARAAHLVPLPLARFSFGAAFSPKTHGGFCPWAFSR